MTSRHCLIGIGAALLVYAAVIGALSFRCRIGIGLAGIGVVRADRGSGGNTQPGRWVARRCPSRDCRIDAAGAGALWLSHRVALPLMAAASNSEAAADDAPARGPASGGAGHRVADGPTRATRRELLAADGGLIAVLALVGTGAGAVGRTIRSRFSAAESRMGVVLPRARSAAPSCRRVMSVGIDGVAPFVTPNRDFYRIDTALTFPRCRPTATNCGSPGWSIAR